MRMAHKDIFRIGSNRHRISEWLGIVFVCVLGYWAALYMASAQAEALAETYTAQVQAYR